MPTCSHHHPAVLGAMLDRFSPLDIQTVTAIPRIHFDLDLMAIGAPKQGHGVLLASPFLTV